MATFRGMADPGGWIFSRSSVALFGSLLWEIWIRLILPQSNNQMIDLFSSNLFTKFTPFRSIVIIMDLYVHFYNNLFTVLMTRSMYILACNNFL